MSFTNSKSIAAFRRIVWNHWRRHGRHDLPWRKTKDPYRILVSEVMLQQTQVPRVIEKYREFVEAFPNVRVLSSAPLAEVLRVWSGMGYNRRAKYLRDAAKIIVEKQGGRVPRDAAVLRALPGTGVYTASAVRVFAFNEPDVLIETNIRAAFIHHFFAYPPTSHGRSRLEDISDANISTIAEKAARGQDPQAWHSALMDYGAQLKRSGVRNNHRSAHYTKQAKFVGSLRQVRGAVLRVLQDGRATEAQIRTRSNLVNPRFDLGRFDRALAGLARDGLIVKEKRKWRVA